MTAIKFGSPGRILPFLLSNDRERETKLANAVVTRHPAIPEWPGTLLHRTTDWGTTWA